MINGARSVDENKLNRVKMATKVPLTGGVIADAFDEENKQLQEVG
jgi:hypothetical protein